jgi:hypothetical protein
MARLVLPFLFIPFHLELMHFSCSLCLPQVLLFPQYLVISSTPMLDPTKVWQITVVAVVILLSLINELLMQYETK